MRASWSSGSCGTWAGPPRLSGVPADPSSSRSSWKARRQMRTSLVRWAFVPFPKDGWSNAALPGLLVGGDSPAITRVSHKAQRPSSSSRRAGACYPCLRLLFLSRCKPDTFKEIERYLSDARIILLLISPTFLSSPDCYDIQMSRALERYSRGEARVVPILLRPSAWQSTPLKDLQPLPKDGKPISKHNKDDIFFEVSEEIGGVIKILGPAIHGGG